LAVGWPCERNQAPLASDEVAHLDHVAHGPDRRVARAHLLVHAYAAEATDRKAGAACQGCLRPHADGQHDQVGIKPGTAGGSYQEPAFLCFEAGHAVGQAQAHVVAS